MRTSRFSTDPKVKLVSISDFLEKNDYLVDYEMHLWNGEKPEINEYYYKVTDKHLIYIRYGRTIINFGMDAKEQLEEIQVAYRDGKSEYHAFEQKIKMLQEKYQMNPEEKSIAIFLKKIENLYDKINDIFPQFNGEDSQKNERRLKDFIVDTGCKCNDYKYDKKYLVFDVETNGVRPVNDDLLCAELVALLDNHSDELRLVECSRNLDFLSFLYIDAALGDQLCILSQNCLFHICVSPCSLVLCFAIFCDFVNIFSIFWTSPSVIPARSMIEVKNSLVLDISSSFLKYPMDFRLSMHVSDAASILDEGTTLDCPL